MSLICCRRMIIGLLCFPLVGFSADSSSQSGRAAKQDIFIVDPVFAVQVIRIMGRQVLEHCLTNYPETRTSVMAEWEAWPYSKVKIDIFVNGKHFDNESSLRAYAEQKFPLASLPMEEGRNLCATYPLVLKKMSGAIPADRTAQFISTNPSP